MNKVTDVQRKELEALKAMPDEAIDTNDIPLIDEAVWRDKAVVGNFYRPIKMAVTIRLDTDVLAWFKAHHSRYQTAVNRVLREYMETH